MLLIHEIRKSLPYRRGIFTANKSNTKKSTKKFLKNTSNCFQYIFPVFVVVVSAQRIEVGPYIPSYRWMSSVFSFLCCEQLNLAVKPISMQSITKIANMLYLQIYCTLQWTPKSQSIIHICYTEILISVSWIRDKETAVFRLLTWRMKKKERSSFHGSLVDVTLLPSATERTTAITLLSAGHIQ